MQAGVCLPPAPEMLPVSCLVPTSLPPLRWLTSAQEQGWLRTGKSFLLISFEQLKSLLRLWEEPRFLLCPWKGTQPGTLLG